MQPTGIPTIDRSFRRQDRSGFARSVEEMNLESVSADALYAVIHHALSLELVRLARDLTAHGLHRYSNDRRFPEMARILAPPEVSRGSAASQVDSRAASRAWLKANQHQYPGLWLAVCDGQLLGTARTLAELRPRLSGLEGVLTVRVQP